MSKLRVERNRKRTLITKQCKNLENSKRIIKNRLNFSNKSKRPKTVRTGRTAGSCSDQRLNT